MTPRPTTVAIPVAYFITPHGFGHAARASAVMNAVFNRLPQVHFHIYTTVPRWFFSTSVRAPFTYHELLTDIGLVKATPLDEDCAKTLELLDNYYPLTEKRLEGTAHNLRRQSCQLVLCDIAPLGIAAAAKAGITSVLIENFTWDWIYAPYVDRLPAFFPHIKYLQRLFGTADHRIQAQPVCAAAPGSETTLPISRSATESRVETRRRLSIPANQPVVLVTMGGVPDDRKIEARLGARDDIVFIQPGGIEPMHRHGNVIRLPHHSPYFHPDLIQCADIVVGKAGYSTLAEVYQAGTPFGYVLRPAFRESPVLEAFIAENMPSVALDPEDYRTGKWIDQLDRLLSLPPDLRSDSSGATQAAALILKYLPDNAG